MIFSTLARLLLTHAPSTTASGRPVGTLDVGLLIARLWAGMFMLIGHGWSKTGYEAASFPDPLGIGNRASFYGAVFSEVVCAGLLAIGLFSRLACVPLVFTMLIAAFVIHKADPFFMGGGAAKEPAMIYGLTYFALLFTGPGRLSLDWRIFRKAMPGFEPRRV